MYDIICVGKSTIDVFVKFSSENKFLGENHNVCYHLGDKIPVEDLVFSTGGGATNTAVAFSRLGLRTGIITAIGDDHNGKLILDELKKERVSFLGTIKKGNSGYSIILPGKGDRTIMVYSGVNNELRFSDIVNHRLTTKWFYFSSLSGTGLEAIKILAEKQKKGGGKCALNISQYLAKEGINKLSPILKNIDVFILNEDEAKLLTKKERINDIIGVIKKHTPAIIAITNGEEAIHAYDPRTEKIMTKRISKIKVVDSTGAGDAFASGFTYAIINNKTIEKAINYGYRESVAVLKHVGAKNNLLRKIRI